MNDLRMAGLLGAAHLAPADGVVHPDPASAVFEAMLEGWATQQRARFLKVNTIEPRTAGSPVRIPTARSPTMRTSRSRLSSRVPALPATVARAVLATLPSAVCFDAATLAGLYKLGRRLGGRPLARAFVFAYLL